MTDAREETDLSNIGDWNVAEISEWVNEIIGGEAGKKAADKFEEQEIDGETLLYLAEVNSYDQWYVCGVGKIKDQLLIKRLLENGRKQPKLNAKKKPSTTGMDPIQKASYLVRKKRVREFVIAKWPGNHIPTFKKKSSFQEELNDLVEEIAPSCLYPEVGFDKNSIRQHALDVLNERRRNVRNGFDYTKPDRRTLKSPKASTQRNKINFTVKSSPNTANNFSIESDGIAVIDTTDKDPEKKDQSPKGHLPKSKRPSETVKSSPSTVKNSNLESDGNAPLNVTYKNPVKRVHISTAPTQKHKPVKNTVRNSSMKTDGPAPLKAKKTNAKKKDCTQKAPMQNNSTTSTIKSSLSTVKNSSHESDGTTVLEYADHSPLSQLLDDVVPTKVAKSTKLSQIHQKSSFVDEDDSDQDVDHSPSEPNSEEARTPLSQRVNENSEGMTKTAIFWGQYKNGRKAYKDGLKTSTVYVEDTQMQDTQDACMQPVLQDDAISELDKGQMETIISVAMKRKTGAGLSRNALFNLAKRLELKPKRGIDRNDLLQQITKYLLEEEYVKVVGTLERENITLVKGLPKAG